MTSISTSLNFNLALGRSIQQCIFEIGADAPLRTFRTIIPLIPWFVPVGCSGGGGFRNSELLKNHRGFFFFLRAFCTYFFSWALLRTPRCHYQLQCLGCELSLACTISCQALVSSSILVCLVLPSCRITCCEWHTGLVLPASYNTRVWVSTLQHRQLLFVVVSHYSLLAVLICV